MIYPEKEPPDFVAIAVDALSVPSWHPADLEIVARIVTAVEPEIRRDEAKRMNERWRNQVIPGLTNRIRYDTEAELRRMVSDLLEENAEVMADSDAQPSEWQEALGADKALRALLEKIEDWGTVR